MKRGIYVTVLASLLALGSAAPAMMGCCGDLGSQLKEGMEKSIACKDDIKKEMGVEANVSFNISNGRKVINVVLSETPPGDAVATKAKVEAIVRKHFPDADEIDVKM
jgi:hypothetical protein